MAAAAASSSECSSGCQSGWTTYLDDHSSSRSRGTHGKPYYYHCDDYSEEDDLSMISDASSGPRGQQCSAGNDAESGRAAERRGRPAARRQGKKAAAAAAAASLLEDTASSPAFFGYSKATRSGEANGYGYGYADDEPMMEMMGNAADFSCAFSATTGFKSHHPFNGTPLDGYLQMHCSPVAAKQVPPTRQAVRRDAGDTKRW